MKILLQSAVVIAVLTAASCKDAPKADEAKTTEAQAVQTPATGAGYNVDVRKSKLEWIGTKPTGRHHGTVAISQGNIFVKDNALVGGNFTIDLKTIAAYDDDNSANAKLEGHLKSQDFFEVDKNGTATFEITGVQAGVNTSDKDLVMKDATHTITGNLKIKDITKSITFPAKVVITGNTLVADADFNINRTLWGITYKSDKSLGDKVIHDDINFKVHLEANQ